MIRKKTETLEDKEVPETVALDDESEIKALNDSNHDHNF